jgi:hypothetical protein
LFAISCRRLLLLLLLLLLRGICLCFTVRAVLLLL